jgi:zinc protease
MFATYFGDPSLLNEQVDRYRQVRTSDVNAFIAKRLGADNRASLLYVPREGEAEPANVADLAETVV